MPKTTYCNLDVEKALFLQFKEVISEGFDAPPNDHDVPVEGGMHCVFVMRSRPFNEPEVLKRRAFIEGRLAVSSDPSLKPAKIIIFESVDGASTNVTPDYTLLNYTIENLKKRFGDEVDIGAVALRFRQTSGDAFTAPALEEFAITPLEQAFTSEDALEIFNRELDARGIELDLTALPLDDASVAEVIGDIVRDSAAKIGMNKAMAKAVEPYLESALT